MPTVLLSTLFVLVPAPVSRVALVVMLVVVVVVVDELLTLSIALASLAGAPIDMLAPRSLVVTLLTVGWRWHAETESAAPATRAVRMKSLRMLILRARMPAPYLSEPARVQASSGRRCGNPLRARLPRWPIFRIA